MKMNKKRFAFVLVLFWTLALVGEQPQRMETFLLVNGQETEKHVAINPMPVLIFGLDVQVGKQSKLCLYDHLEAFQNGLRRSELFREANLLFVDFYIDGRVVLVDFLKRDIQNWKSIIKPAFPIHYISKNPLGNQLYTVSNDLNHLYYPLQCHIGWE